MGNIFDNNLTIHKKHNIRTTLGSHSTHRKRKAQDALNFEQGLMLHSPILILVKITYGLKSYHCKSSDTRKFSQEASIDLNLNILKIFGDQKTTYIGGKTAYPTLPFATGLSSVSFIEAFETTILSSISLSLLLNEHLNIPQHPPSRNKFE